MLFVGAPAPVSVLDALASFGVGLRLRWLVGMLTIHLIPIGEYWMRCC